MFSIEVINSINKEKPKVEKVELETATVTSLKVVKNEDTINQKPGLITLEGHEK